MMESFGPRCYWTAYNEIDQRVYDGTPLFETYDDAESWLSEQVNVRPSTGIVFVWVKPFWSTFRTLKPQNA